MDKESMLDERRENKRYRAVPILTGTNPSTYHMSVLHDVSLNGAFFLNREPPPLGTDILLRFEDLPLAGYVLKGRVVRHAHEHVVGFGVEFSEMHPRLLRAFYHPGKE